MAAKWMNQTKNNFGSQFLRAFLVILVVVPTLLLIVAAGAVFFGYRPTSIEGTSMEPALQNGDALWIKYVNPAEVNAGDIVALEHPSKGLVGHRVITIETLSHGSYFIVTKGDANSYAEEWIIGAGEKVGAAFVRVRFLGHALNFGRSMPGRVLTLGSGIALVVVLIMLRRSQKSRKD